MLFGWNTNVLERSSPNIKITCLPNKSILHCPSRSSCSAVSHFSEDISANKYSCLLFSSFAPLRLCVIILFQAAAQQTWLHRRRGFLQATLGLQQIAPASSACPITSISKWFRP